MKTLILLGLLYISSAVLPLIGTNSKEVEYEFQETDNACTLTKIEDGNKININYTWGVIGCEPKGLFIDNEDTVWLIFYYSLYDRNLDSFVQDTAVNQGIFDKVPSGASTLILASVNDELKIDAGVYLYSVDNFEAESPEFGDVEIHEVSICNSTQIKFRATWEYKAPAVGDDGVKSFVGIGAEYTNTWTVIDVSDSDAWKITFSEKIRGDNEPVCEEDFEYVEEKKSKEKVESSSSDLLILAHLTLKVMALLAL